MASRCSRQNTSSRALTGNRNQSAVFTKPEADGCCKQAFAVRTVVSVISRFDELRKDDKDVIRARGRVTLKGSCVALPLLFGM
jgi:hypothetical protein